jgi:hypothetical protein
MEVSGMHESDVAQAHNSFNISPIIAPSS